MEHVSGKHLQQTSIYSFGKVSRQVDHQSTAHSLSAIPLCQQGKQDGCAEVERVIDVSTG